MKERIKTVPGFVGHKVWDKLDKVLQRNVGRKGLRTASDILEGENTVVQSHLYIRRGNRRLSLAALPGLPAASRGVKLRCSQTLALFF